MAAKRIGVGLDSRLPKLFLPNINKTQAVNYIKGMLNEELPKSDRASLETDLKWSFQLNSQSNGKKKKKQRQVKKQGLTRKERKRLGLLKLPRTGWKYENVLQMNEMWMDYMRENLECAKKAPSCTDGDYGNFVAVVSKSEFIGAEIAVVRSTVPSYVGLKGIVVLETKQTFQIVTAENKLKIVLKQVSVFLIVLDAMRFTIFGKSLMARPSERSVKKLKSYVVPDL